VAGLSHPTAMRDEIQTKNCFGFKGKVPFITDRLQPNDFSECMSCERQICRKIPLMRQKVLLKKYDTLQEKCT
jgi:hypothetical protein